MKYTTETEKLMMDLKEDGLNIFAMIHIYKRRSKLSPDIPEEVVRQVCLEYLRKKGQILHGFPYFLTILRAKTEDYFAKQNVQEGERIKKEPLALKDIMKQLSGG